MRLKKVRITNYQSVQDSTEFNINDVTCLVGKNEAGKTALLKALYRLNPIHEEDGTFNETRDFPRQSMARYKRDIKNGNREPAVVVVATYDFEEEDLVAVRDVFGDNCFTAQKPTLTLSKGYSNELCVCDLEIDQEAILKHLIQTANLPLDDTNLLLKAKNLGEIVSILEKIPSDHSELLEARMRRISETGISLLIFDEVLKSLVPKFLYFDEYYQMQGQDNLGQFVRRVKNKKLHPSDHPLLGLIGLSNLQLDELVDPSSTQDLMADLDAAGSALTSAILPYWSQNKNLQIRFDIRKAHRNDPPGMQKGTNIWGLVYNTQYGVTIPIGTRSRGFIWFFSFMAWYSDLLGSEKNLILLLDEPGLSLHAKAQGDLLRFFDEQLKPNHQLIYTTHSPFMIDASGFEYVRIVQDLSIEPGSDKLSADQQGTRVTTDVYRASQDSLFPLQGALGYEIHQTLFVGPNCLIVEGVADKLYIEAISGTLQRRQEEGLSPKWVITPVGGASKVSTFVSLIGSQKNLNVATLIDYQKKDEQEIENLWRKKLLEKNRVFTYAHFTPEDEADVEDMFDPDFYVGLVNGEYGSSIAVKDLTHRHPRVLRRIESYLQENRLPGGAEFNHYRPARYFQEHISNLESKLDEFQLDRWRKVFCALNSLLK